MLVLFPICTFTWRMNCYVSRQVKGISRRNESTTHNFCCLSNYKNNQSFYFVFYNFLQVGFSNENIFSFHRRQSFFL